MDEADIQKEIERRKKRAKDLKLREMLWKLYDSHLSRYPDTLQKESETLHPDIRDNVAIENGYYRFRVGDVAYKVHYKEINKDTENYGSQQWVFEVERTQIMLSLTVDDQLVFSFKLRKTIERTPDGPLFNESMGDVTAFIEGPWVAELPQLIGRMETHRQAVWKERRAPDRARKLQEDMKRFGL